MRIRVLGVTAVGLMLAACGSTTEQRAATGGLTGAGAGALIAGPVGAAVGAAVGGFGGWAIPEGADTIAERAIGEEKHVAQAGLKDVGLGPSGTSQAAAQPPQVRSQMQMVKQAQTELQHEGLYHGSVDGIVGPETRRALATYQQNQGLPQTATLDQATLARMNLGQAAPAAAGTSSPGAMMDPDQIRNRLQADGYSNVTDVRHQSDNTFTARAMWGNTAYAVRVDGQTGKVVEQQQLSSAGQSDQQTGGASNPGDTVTTSH